MATFPDYKPRVGASKSSAPTVRSTKFGDGYEQRVRFGLNQDPKEWTLEWNVTEEVSDEIETFLEARAGAESFDWTPPDTSTSYKWICSEWQKSIDEPFRAVIRATFRQVLSLSNERTYPWQSSTAHSVGDVVQAFTDPGTGFFFRCTVAGTTGTAEPFWPTIIGNTVEDGTVTWMAVSIISGDLQGPAPSAIIELFELQLFANIHGVSDIYRFHAGTNLINNGEVVWKGNAYLRFPVEADGFEYTGQGALPRPKIRISNILGSITAILLSLPNGLEAAKVTRIRTLGRYLDAANFPAPGDILLEDGDVLLLEDGSSFLLEPINATEDFSAEFPREIYYIDRKSAENREIVEFELASVFDLAGVRAPKRQCIANICQWVYRSTECGYIGTNYFDANNNAVGSASLDVCGKRLSSCQVRFGANAELPYGSYPGISQTAG
jgi:phage-related protein